MSLSLAAIEMTTVPFPEPDAPEVMVTKLASLAAVHAQPACVVTVTDLVLAAAAVSML